MPFKIKQASPASRKQKEVAVDHSIKCVRTKKRKQVPSASCESSICSITVTFATLYLSKHSDVEQVYIMLKDCRACTNCTPNIPSAVLCDIWLSKYTEQEHALMPIKLLVF